MIRSLREGAYESSGPWLGDVQLKYRLAGIYLPVDDAIDPDGERLPEFDRSIRDRVAGRSRCALRLFGRSMAVRRFDADIVEYLDAYEGARVRLKKADNGTRDL
jgi:hypothetical protein